MASEAQPSTTHSTKIDTSRKALKSQRSLPKKQAEKDEMPQIQGCHQRLREKHNPFKMPRDSDIFVLRDIEKEEKRKEQEEQKKLKIYEKTTYTTRVNAKCGKAQIMEEELETDPEAEHKANVKKLSALKSDPSWKVKVTRGQHIENETLTDYINKKREMFILQNHTHALSCACAVDWKVLQRFVPSIGPQMLQCWDQEEMIPNGRAERETKLKLEKVAEMKKLTTQLMAVKNDIAKFEETLKDYRVYKDFLMKLSPKEWKEEREKRRKEIKLAKVTSRESSKMPPSDVISQQSSKIPIQSISSVRTLHLSTKSFQEWRKSSDIGIESKLEEQEWSDSDEETELYFTDPKQLLAIYTELEEQNLSLILNSQETEEAVEELKQAMVTTQLKMNCETDALKQQLNILSEAVAKEESRAADLELKAKMFSFSQSTIEDQDKMLEALDQKVMEVYRSCIGVNEANMSTLQMLTSIENYLEELFENLEKLPREKVELAEKNKEKERRMRLREEKLREEKLHQEERIHRAMLRSQAEHQKKTGRKLVYRSEPPLMKELQKQVPETTDQQQEEADYYFSL
ncbi:cilia- and flagella-associated protein 100 isoform X2 [Narcine bancroftii]|uniref:cilia- and flagella-associated protein 100 isoform X2 n=1 Tax=Narcine bancroftii TaxID=1343680 RepID=UPI003831FE71